MVFMLKEKELVILLSRDSLKFGLVVLGRKPKIGDVFSTDWSESNLTEIFKKIKEQAKKDSARVVFEDEICTVIDKVVMPEKELLTKISTALNEAGISLQTAEASLLSSTRNANPMIGIALKEDIEEGKKILPEVVEITPKQDLPAGETGEKAPVAAEAHRKMQESAAGEKPLMEEVKPKPKVAVLVLIFIVIGALVSGGLIVYRRSMEANLSGKAAGDLSPTPQVTAVPTPEINKEDLKIEILNGGGRSGEAKKLATYLEGLGYKIQKTGNAGSFDNETTKISLKDSKKGILNQLKKDLSTSYQVDEEVSSLDEASEFDVIVVIGKK